MKKRGRKTAIPWIWILLVTALALVAGYFLGVKTGREASTPLDAVSPRPAQKEVPKVEAPIPVRQEGTAEEKGAEADQQECRKIQGEIRDFFSYLNSKPYIREIEEGIDTYEWFKRIGAKLSAHLPVPAGEALDSMAMTGNVFHLFRRLEGKEIRLIRDILQNEASTLEMNLELFFRWFRLGDRCPDPQGWRPSQDVLYAYAGFFVNTIGGRAYLFRRPGALRSLVTYYCVLILHDAQKRGRNSYGIDLAPPLRALVNEMALQPHLRFQAEYMERLRQLQGLYRPTG